MHNQVSCLCKICKIIAAYIINFMLSNRIQKYSWFQTFAVFWMVYAFFWVIPRRLNFICRRFRTLCLFHLHRQVGVWRMTRFEICWGIDTGKGMAKNSRLDWIYEGCPESIQPFWISREPVAWPWCNMAASQGRPYCVFVNSHSPMGLVSWQWDAVDWACVLCDRRIHNDRVSR